MNSNERDGKLGVVKITLTESGVATAAAVTMKGGGEQINGREGETATFLSRCPLNLELRVGGFAPRHLSRSPPRGGRTKI